MTDHISQMLVAAREELVRADTKAAVLLAATGVGIGALLGGLLSGNWSPFELANWIEWAWWLGAAAAAFAVWRLGYAVYPRTKRKGPPPTVLGYFDDVNKFRGTTAELKRALLAAAPEDRQVDQLRETSRIVGAKYDGIKTALGSLGLAAVLCAGAVLLDAAFG